MNIGIYTRKSVFSDKSDSTESQANMCKEYAKNNYKITSITKYEDEGFTGANTNRPSFTRLIKDVTDKKIDIVICYKIDRISRNVLDFSSTFDTLQKHNVQFVSVKEQIDTSTPLGRAMMYICSVFAQMERETTAERVKDSMIELAKSGKWAGGKAPIGFKRKRITLNGKHHTILEKNDDELTFLNMIFDTFIEGYSLSGLETYFRNKGIKTLSDNYLSSSQLHQILTTPHYVEATPEIYNYFKSKGCVMATNKEKFDGKHGIIVYGRTSGGKKKTHTVNTADKWIVSIGLHKPIITSKKWLAVQECFGKNKFDKTRKHEIGLLKGIVKCKCGYTMRVQHKVDKIYNKTYDNYFCQNRNRKGKEYCDMRMIRVSILDSTLLKTLRSISLDKEMLEKLMENYVVPSTVRSKEIVTKEIKALQKKIGNLTNTLQDNTNSTASKYIIAEIEKLDKQITNLNCELREISFQQKEESTKKNNVDTIYNEICLLVNKFDILTYEEKNKHLEQILKDCTWDGKELLIHF